MASQSAPIVSHNERVQFDHMLIQTRSSWFGWAPIRAGTLAQLVDQPLTVLTSLLIFSLLSIGPCEHSPCSDEGLCLYLHPWLDEDSMAIFEIIINVIVGQGQFRHALLCCPRT